MTPHNYHHQLEYNRESVALQQAVVTNMPKPSSQHQTLHNRRYPDFWRRRKNQIVAGVLITGFTLIVLVGLIYLIRNGTSYKVTYTGDALLRIFPKSERDRNFLEKFDTLNLDAQVWGLPSNANVPVYVYAKTGSMHRLERMLEFRNLTFTVLIEDVQALINREEKSINDRRAEHSVDEGFDFETYHPYEEIGKWLNELATSSSLVTLTSMNKTHHDRDLHLVSISSGPITRYDSMGHPEEIEKPVIYINCGIHAREWIAVSTCLWLINQLTDVNNTDATQLLNTFDFWLVPVANPDGYVYSWTFDRMWRKNRSPNEKCVGVDLNRNFDMGFNETSRNSCSNSYGGREPEDQVETRTMIDLLSSNQHKIKSALFIHSFSQLWLSPYGVNGSLPAEYSEMERVMSKAVSALQAIYKTSYQYGSVANVLYSAPGNAIDYCYEKLGIVHSYTLELRDTGTNAFMLPLEQILPTAVETWEGVKAMAEAIRETLPHQFHFH